MRLLKVLNSLLIIPKIDILEGLVTLVTNEAFLMILLQMPPKLINIIENLLTELAKRMIQNQIAIIRKLPILNMSLIFRRGIKNLL
jgi:hypothetical protein